MRICLIGKFPPIQGGVSMRTYWTAHELARRGHEVHVVTNALEVQPRFRMVMRAEDWERCESRCGSGSVAVHWTDPVDRSQTHIPMASPFVSKLASLAAEQHAQRPFDVVHAFYMEPYGIAGHLAAQMAGVPYVVRMAGSDAGRLWHHPQFTRLYDHVLRSAELVLAAGPVARRAIEHGVDPARIAFGGGFTVPEALFTPEGPALDLIALRREAEEDPQLRDFVWGGFAGDRPHFGVYGKLGEKKGSFALLDAMAQLKRTGVDVGLVALAHGPPEVERRFRARATELGLADRILQLPFVPHWRIPAFLRGCGAVCCLEQDFPIAFHTPIVAREVLLAGACLVGSAEILRKLPHHERLPSGFGCVAIADVSDVGDLADRLAAIAGDPAPRAALGARGRAFARDLQHDIPFPHALETALEAAAVRRRPPVARSEPDAIAADGRARYRFRRMAAAAAAEGRDTARAGPRSAALAEAVRLEGAVDAALHEDGAPVGDPLFRLKIGRWALAAEDLAELVPVRAANLRLFPSQWDLREILGATRVDDLPSFPSSGPSSAAVLTGPVAQPSNPLILDPMTARILALSDGVRTVAQIVACLDEGGDAGAIDRHRPWIEALFANGLIDFVDARPRAPGPPV
jgi:glycosyltransferase involved in cell wall biosynthesis